MGWVERWLERSDERFLIPQTLPDVLQIKVQHKGLCGFIPAQFSDAGLERLYCSRLFVRAQLSTRAVSLFMAMNIAAIHTIAVVQPSTLDGTPLPVESLTIRTFASLAGVLVVVFGLAASCVPSKRISFDTHEFLLLVFHISLAIFAPLTHTFRSATLWLKLQGRSERIDPAGSTDTALIMTYLILISFTYISSPLRAHRSFLVGLLYVLSYGAWTFTLDGGPDAARAPGYMAYIAIVALMMWMGHIVAERLRRRDFLHVLQSEAMRVRARRTHRAHHATARLSHPPYPSTHRCARRTSSARSRRSRTTS